MCGRLLDASRQPPPPPASAAAAIIKRRATVHVPRPVCRLLQLVARVTRVALAAGAFVAPPMPMQAAALEVCAHPLQQQPLLQLQLQQLQQLQ